jgi:hypothetical protein
MGWVVGGGGDKDSVSILVENHLESDHLEDQVGDGRIP